MASPTRAILDVHREYRRARERYPVMHSMHEGWGVLREEYLELETEFMAKRHDHQRIYDEAKQVAAMAVAIMTELCNVEGETR